MAAGVLDEVLSHEDVKKTAELVKNQFKEIIKEFIAQIQFEVNINGLNLFLPKNKLSLFYL